MLGPDTSRSIPTSPQWKTIQSPQEKCYFVGIPHILPTLAGKVLLEDPSKWKPAPKNTALNHQYKTTYHRDPEEHNRRESHSRKEMKETFQGLQRAIQEARKLYQDQSAKPLGSCWNPDSNLPRIQILNAAINLIHSLQAQEEKLKAEKKELLEHGSRLTARRLNALIARKNHSHRVCYHRHFKCDAKIHS